MKWEINKKYTVISVSDMLGMTSKTEIQIKELDKNENPIFVLRGKRKLRQLVTSDRTQHLVFENWDIDLKIDSEASGVSDGLFTSKTMIGNACFNFLGSVDFVKDFIEKHNINEYFNKYDAILSHGDIVTNDSGMPVYPEVPTTHAVILATRKKLGLNIAPEVVFSYDRAEAIEDGILTKNPRQDVFNECDIITANLLEKVENDEFELLGCLMMSAKEIYENKDFKGDNDKDFFVLPKTEEFGEIWMVRNESGHLTAMLPDDY